MVPTQNHPDHAESMIFLYFPDREKQLQQQIYTLIHSLTSQQPVIIHNEQQLYTNVLTADLGFLLIHHSCFTPHLASLIAEFALPTLAFIEKEKDFEPFLTYFLDEIYLIDFIKIPETDSEELRLRVHRFLASSEQLKQINIKTKEQSIFFELTQEGIWFAKPKEPIPTNIDPEKQIALMFQTGLFEYCNKKFAEMYGFDSPISLKGKPISDLLIPDDPANYEYLKAFIQSGYNLQGVLSHEKDKDGNDKYFSNSLIGIVSSGYLIGAWGTQLDVTEEIRLRKQLEENLAFQKSVNQFAETLLHTQDIDQLLHTATENIRKILNVGSTTMLLLPYDEVVQSVKISSSPELPDDIRQTLEATALSTSSLPPDIHSYNRADPPLFLQPFFTHFPEVQTLFSIPLRYGTNLYGFLLLGYDAPTQFETVSSEKHEVIVTILSAILRNHYLQLQLYHREQQWANLIENAPIAITRFLLQEHRYDFVNREFTRQSGYTKEEFDALSDQELIEMIHPEDRQRIFSFYKRWSSQGFPGVQRIDYRIRNRNGEEIWLDTYCYAEFDNEGNPQAIVQLCSDITELRKAQRELQKALQEEYRETLKNIQGIVARFRRSADGHFIFTLREGLQTRGLTTADVEGKTPHDVFEKHYADQIVATLQKTAELKQPYSAELQWYDQYLLGSYYPIIDEHGEVQEIVVSLLDITKLKEYEKELIATQERYYKLLESLPVGVAVLEVLYAEKPSESQQSTVEKIIVTYANPAFEKNTGYTSEEFARAGSLIYEEDQDRVYEAWGTWVSDPDDRSIYTDSYRIVQKSGEVRWIELYAVKLPTLSPQIYEVVEVGLDITDRKRAEERLEYLASFPEQNTDPIFEVLQDGTLLYLNPAAKSLFPDLPEQRWNHPLLRELSEQWKLLMRYVHRPYVRELRYHGRIFEEHIFYIPTAQSLRVYCTDITLKRLTEQQLRLALERERMYSQFRSRFIRLISHQIRTPLTAIASASEILQRYKQRITVEKQQELLQNVLQQSKILEDLMHNFAFYNSLYEMQIKRKQPTKIQLSDFLAHLRSTFDSFKKEGQVLKTEVTGIPEIFSHNRTLLDYALRILLDNATRFSEPNSTIWVRIQKQQDTLVLEVEDQGIGIPKDQLSEIFHPFFRARNALQYSGTGLSLAILKEFIDLVGGRISVESEENKGTRVRIELPYEIHSGIDLSSLSGKQESSLLLGE